MRFKALNSNVGKSQSMLLISRKQTQSRRLKLIMGRNRFNHREKKGADAPSRVPEGVYLPPDGGKSLM